MSDNFQCTLCACWFCTEDDLNLHMNAFGSGEEHLRKFRRVHKSIEYGREGEEYGSLWRKSSFDNEWWCYRDDDPKFASDLASNGGKATMAGYDYSLNGKYIKKRLYKL